LKCGQRSKEKKIQERKHLFYIEDDLRDPRASSFLNVSEAAYTERKRQVTKYQEPKIIQEKNIIVQRGCHAGPILQQRYHRLRGCTASKEKGK
jgi:hypothetical protein